MAGAAAALKSAMINAFVDMGRAIGAVLAGLEGGMESFSSAILKLFGTFLQTLGRVLIAIGVAAIPLRFFLLNPATAIVAGIALVALGSALAGAAGHALATTAGGAGGGLGRLPPPPGFEGGRLNVTIQIVARDLDREGSLRILEEINASGQLDRPIQLDTALVRID